MCRKFQQNELKDMLAAMLYEYNIMNDTCLVTVIDQIIMSHSE